VVGIFDDRRERPDIFDNETLKLELKSGDKYVLDLTCAQYGYVDPIILLGEYERDRIEFYLNETLIWTVGPGSTCWEPG
jgi:hypothetical protein